MRPADFLTGLLFALWFGVTTVSAEPPEATKNSGSIEVTPSLELLEFLGEFETEDGEWIDPEEPEDMDSMDDNQDPQYTREDDRD